MALEEPKLKPVNMTVSDPSTDPLTTPTPDKDDMTGLPYEVMGLTDSCVSTTTDQEREAPAPGAVRHLRTEWAVYMEQLEVTSNTVPFVLE
jgi:hypothetical protein